MPFYYNGGLIGSPRGPAGPDGNPLGTIISFMGTAAPKDYLVCDGAEYSVSDYPDLAQFFQEQFGAANHCGGDGTSTFAVPDMRNLFLRGYHGESEEQLSGEIGVKQDATEIVNLPVDENFVGWYGNNISPNNIDAWSDERSNYRRVLHNATSSSSSTQPSAHTTRPVNMAVLYCIKAVESLPAGDIYSTEERIVGTWIDDRPIYKRNVEFQCSTYNAWEAVYTNTDIDILVDSYGFVIIMLSTTSPSYQHVPDTACSFRSVPGSRVEMYNTNGANKGRTFHLAICYTKLSDIKEG